MAAASSLIKKGKMKEVNELKQRLEADEMYKEVEEFIATGKRPWDLGPPASFYDASNFQYNTLAVFTEFNKKAKTGFIMGFPPPEIMGGVYRDCGSKCVIVSLDKRSGGADITELRRFTREQYRARTMLPGSLPVLMNDFIVDKFQLEVAATYGVAAVTLYPDLIYDLPEAIR
jgi:indole-3-glycerol phosphate synthase